MGKLGVANSGGSSDQRSDLGWRSPNSVPLSDDCLSAAEEAAQRVLNCVQPTLDSEEKRRDIVDYVQRLIKSHLNCEVFPYGSVPLKTYLPEGDIDLTALQSPNAQKSLARDVLALLKREEKNTYSEFLVKDTQFIDAEVQLVKCLVQNVVIDISFNQLGGLSTLCFLEQVDRLIGRNNLFKRSIILVKTWCYYESRILGAHHGLISTYALETLVLYIFHLFHSSLNGPLAVLYKFLDYYSQFDWDNYCISLKGPVCKSSLPDIVVSIPENEGDDLMFSKEFLENCVEMFSFTSRTLDGKPKMFQAKHLNIIDPLKENNNLGRSVNKGSFYRIRSAFKYGSHKLSQALLQPKAKVADVINDFFPNTLSMHVNGNRSSSKHLALELHDRESFTVSSTSAVELLSGNESLRKSSARDADNQCVGLEFNSEMDRYCMRQLPLVKSSGGYSAKQVVPLGGFIIGEANDSSPFMSNLRNTPDFAPTSNSSAYLSWSHNHKPPSFYNELSAKTGSSGTGNSLQSDLASRKLCFISSTQDNKGHGEMNGPYVQCMDSLQANVLDKFSLDFRKGDLTSVGELESFNPLADLSGDYDSHIRSLLHGQLCHGFSLSASITHHAPTSPSWIQVKNPPYVNPPPMPLLQRQSSEMSSYPLSKKNMCLDSDSVLPATTYPHEGKQKTLRITTQSPHSSGFTKERSPLGRSGNEAAVYQYNRCQQTHGLYPGLGKQRNSVSDARRVLPARSKSQGRGRLDTQCQSPPLVGDGNQRNGSFNGSFRIEFGSIGNLGEEILSASAADRSTFLGFSYEKQGTGAVMKQGGGKSRPKK